MISAAQAMEYCLQYMDRDDLEHARMWLDIAHELREGGSGKSLPIGLKADMPTEQWLRPGDAVENIGRCECGYFLAMDPTGQVVHSRTGLIECPVGRPGPDDTVVHTVATPE